MSGIGERTVCAMMDELEKIAAISVPSIKAPTSPAGDGGQMKAQPASPVSPGKIIGKALRSTNLQKTNYTAVGTKVPSPDLSQSWSKNIPAPVVRS